MSCRGTELFMTKISTYRFPSQIVNVYHLDRGSGPSISVNAGQELITLGWVAPRFSTNGYGFYA